MVVRCFFMRRSDGVGVVEQAVEIVMLVMVVLRCLRMERCVVVHRQRLVRTMGAIWTTLGLQNLV